MTDSGSSERFVSMQVQVPASALFEVMRPEVLKAIKENAVAKTVLSRLRPIDQAIDLQVERVCRALARYENTKGSPSEFKATLDLVAACTGLRTIHIDYRNRQKAKKS